MNKNKDANSYSSFILHPLIKGRRWRKRKGVADVRLSDGTIRLAEVHWYEAHGIGKVRMKIKQYLD